MLPLRSQQWWDNPANPDMTALYLERYLNFGLTRTELQSGRPIIGIAQTGSDLVPCNRRHLASSAAIARMVWMDSSEWYAACGVTIALGPGRCWPESSTGEGRGVHSGRPGLL